MPKLKQYHDISTDDIIYEIRIPMNEIVNLDLALDTLKEIAELEKSELTSAQIGALANILQYIEQKLKSRAKSIWNQSTATKPAPNFQMQARHLPNGPLSHLTPQQKQNLNAQLASLLDLDKEARKLGIEKIVICRKCNYRIKVRADASKINCQCGTINYV